MKAAGAPLAQARAAVVMLHGRGSSPDGILSLAPMISTDGVAYLAPAAAGGQWYPLGFMSPIERNEPGITSAMRTIERVLAQVAAAGIPAERTMLLGFSQGACLASEFVARHARRYGGLAVSERRLIGPDDTPRETTRCTSPGTPVFLRCSYVERAHPGGARAGYAHRP